MGAAAPFLGMGASLWGSSKASKTARDGYDSAAAAQVQAAEIAAQAQLDQQQKASDFYREMLTRGESFNQPYTSAGRRGLADFEYYNSGYQPTGSELQNLYGVGDIDRKIGDIQTRLAGLGSTETLKEYIDIREKQLPQWNGTATAEQFMQEIDEAKAKMAQSQQMQEQLTQLQAEREGAISKAEGGYQPGSYEASELYKLQQEALDDQFRTRFGEQFGGKAAQMAGEQQRALGAEEEQRFMNRLYQQAAMGQGSAAASGQAGMQAASGMGNMLSFGAQNLSQIYQGQGAAQAGAAIGSAGAQGGFYSDIAGLGSGIVQNYFNQQTYPQRSPNAKQGTNLNYRNTPAYQGASFLYPGL